MMPRRRFARPGACRDYSDKIADAMGDGCSGDDARAYARGSAPLRLFRRQSPASRESTQQQLVRQTELF